MYGPPSNRFPPHYRGTIVLESMSTGDLGQPPTSTLLYVPTKREANTRPGQASCRLHTYMRERRNYNFDLINPLVVRILSRCACKYTSTLYLQPNYGIIQCETIMIKIRYNEYLLYLCITMMGFILRLKHNYTFIRLLIERLNIDVIYNENTPHY